MVLVGILFLNGFEERVFELYHGFDGGNVFLDGCKGTVLMASVSWLFSVMKICPKDPYPIFCLTL